MSVAPNKLSEILTEVQNSFASNSDISVAPLKGDPPNQYEITYNINGLTHDSQGEIIENTGHVIELTIPFGFPHFPPSCKPKSDIFHPDFDPAAICLGDFWHQDRRLSDLIIYVGKMLNGEIYSTANAFNEEAAAWYTSNHDRLPLSSVNLENLIEDTSSTTASDLEIDTLEDSDLSSDFDYLTLEAKTPDDEISPDLPSPDTVESPSGIDIEFVRLLEKQKKYYTVLETIEDISQPSEEFTEAFQNAKQEIRKAKKFYQEATKLEKLGNPHDALDSYEQVKDTVIDFLNISADITRVQQSLNFLNKLPPEYDSPKKQETKKTSQTQPSEPAPVPLEATNSGKSKLPIYIMICIAILAIATPGYLYYSFSKSLGIAEQSYLQCNSSLEKSTFKAAEKSCKAALASTRKVRYIKQERVATLQASINTILQSEKLIQGLAGNVLWEGKYVSQKVMKELQEINSSVEEANSFLGQGNWQQANYIFVKILPLAENNNYISDSVTEEIRQKLHLTQFKIVYQEAEAYLRNSEWDKSLETFKNAQGLLAKTQQADKLQYADLIKSSLLKCRFEAQKAQGDHYFSMSDWQQATAFYNQALSVVQETELLPEKSAYSITQNTKRAELYATIARGNEAFASGEWNEAIEAYRHGIYLLANNSSLFNQNDSYRTSRKLDKIIQQTSIIRDRQAAKTMVVEHDYANAIKKYNQILLAIESSSFAAEKEFQKTRAEVTSALSSLKEQIFFEEREQYLKNNFQSLFGSIYTNSVPKNLGNLSISLSKEVSNKVIFKLQCTESGGGRPLTLLMYYAYDRNANEWSFYSEGN